RPTRRSAPAAAHASGPPPVPEPEPLPEPVPPPDPAVPVEPAPCPEPELPEGPAPPITPWQAQKSSKPASTRKSFSATFAEDPTKEKPSIPSRGRVTRERCSRGHSNFLVSADTTGGSVAVVFHLTRAGSRRTPVVR